MLLLAILFAILKIIVSFNIMTRKSVVSSINWNIEKNTTLNTKGLESGTKITNIKMT